jgi:mRNA-degrading endonuclease RelE of RelBE toxin-antitoxin system
MPARFVVRLTPSFQRDLERLPSAAQNKILEEVRRLETSPFGPPPSIKKLKAKGVGQWRLQVWPYRVRYDVIHGEVVLYRVRHRKDIYRE